MAIERDLVYRISVANVAQAVKQMSTVADAIRSMIQKEVTLENAVAAAKVTAAKKGAEGKKKIVDDAAKHEAAMTKLQVNVEKQRAKEMEKSARDAAKARIDAAKTAQKEIDKAEKQSLREFEKAEKEKSKIAQREAKVRLDVEKAVGKAQQATAARRLAENAKEFHQMERVALRKARDAAFDRKRFYRGVGTGIVDAGFGAASALSSAARFAGRGARSVASSLGLNDTFDVGDIFAQRMKVQSMMRAVAIEARQAGSGDSKFSETNAYQKIRNTAAATGFSQLDLAKAVDVYSEKGSGATAVTNIDRIASQARAMGTSPEVIAKLRAQMGISSSGPGQTELSEAEKDKMIAKMHFLGKTGVFRAEAMAEESEELFSTFAKGGGDFRTDFDQYLAFANEARKSSGSGAVARTAINAVQNQIAKKDAKITSLGIATHIMGDDGIETQRPFVEVVKDIIQKTGGKGDAFNKIFDPAKSGKAVSTMVRAFQKAGGGDKGRAAMEELLAGDPSLKAATVEEMGKDTASAMQGPQEKMAAAKEKIRNALEDALLPTFEKIANRMPEIIGVITEAIKSIGPILEKLGEALASAWKTLGPILMPMAKAGLDLATSNPLLAVAGAGALKTGGRTILSSLARWGGDALVNTMPGVGGKIAGGLLGAAGNAVGSAGATPVFITGAASGVFGGGGGGGLPGIGGAGMTMATLGPMLAIAAAAAITVAVADHYESGSRYYKSNFDDKGKVTVSTEAYNAGMKEIKDAKREEYEGMMAMMEGREDPKETKKKQAIAYKYFPDLAAKVASGEVSDADAAKAVSTNLKSGLNLKVGSDGNLEQGPTTADAGKLAEAFASIAKQAKEAAANLGDLSTKAGSAGSNVSKIKIGGGTPGAGGT